MMPTLQWTVAALALLLACGWFASAWFYRRRIADLQQQIKAVRHAAAEHASQARRQVGLLQAELARRPPPQPSPTAPAKTETAAKSAPAIAAGRARLFEEDHVPIVIGRSGFAETQVME
jgi:HAMP domain-containing protein